MATTITIGSYVIDASATTSTTPEVKLRPYSDESLGTEPGGLRWNKGTDAASITFWCYVSAATVAALKLAIDELTDNITSPTGDIELADSGTLVTFRTSDGTYTLAKGTVDVELGELSAFVKCTINLDTSGLEGVPPDSGSSEPIEGLVEFVNISANRNTSNKLGMTIEAKFKDTASVAGLTFTSVEDDGNSLARFVFSGTPDFSGVGAGSTLVVVGGAYAGNHIITLADDSADKITTLTAFGATSANTASITGQTADKNALDFIDTVFDRSGAVSGWAWLPPADELRIVSDVVQFTPMSTGSGGQEKAGEAVARILLAEMSADMTALDAIFKDAIATMRINPQIVDQRSGQTEVIAVAISGTLFARVEGNTTFDALQSAASNPSNGQINTAIDLVIATQLSRAGETSTVIETERNVSTNVESGEVSFQISGFLGSPTVIAWDESIIWQFQPTDAVIGDVEGIELVFSQQNRGIFSVSHNLRASALNGAPPYKKPNGIDTGFIPGGPVTIGEPTFFRLRTGQTIVSQSWSGSWRYVNDGKIPSHTLIQQLMGLVGQGIVNGTINTQLGFGGGGIPGVGSFASGGLGIGFA